MPDASFVPTPASTYKFRQLNSPRVLMAVAILTLLALVPHYGWAREGENEFHVISPSNHAQLSSLPVEIKLEFPEGCREEEFRAELNGVDVTRRFGPLTHGTRRAVFYRRNLKLGSNSFTAHDERRVAKVHFTVEQPSGLPGSSQTLGNWVNITTRLVYGDPSQLGSYGIQVGSDNAYWAPYTTYQNYSANGPNGLTGFQVLLLDRLTGNLVSNTSFGTATDVGAEIFASTLEYSGFYSGCGEFGCLLFIQDFQLTSLQDASKVTVMEAIQDVGGSNLVLYYPSMSVYSLISSVSPSGFAPSGSGYENIQCSGNGPTCGDSNIAGALVLDNHNAYSFASPLRVTFSTGTAPGSTSNTITVGGAQYTSDTIPAGQGGIQLVELDRKSLTLLDQFTYTPINAGQLATLHYALNNFQTSCPPAGDSCPLFFISTVGTVAKPTDPEGQEQWYNVAHDLQALVGGTYSVFEQLSAGDDYSILGSFDIINPFPTVEASSVVSRAIQPQGATTLPSNIRGVLTLDRQLGYRPFVSNLTSTFDKSNLSLLDATALQSPGAWPYPQPGHPGQQNAYEYLGSLTCKCDDIRGAYGNQDAPLSIWFDQVSGAKRPSDATFTQADFNLLQTQIENELDFAQTIVNFQTNITDLYIAQNSNVSLLLTSDYAEVEQNLYVPPPPPSSSAGLGVLRALSGALSIASYVTPLGAPTQFALDAGSVLMNDAAASTNNSNGNPSLNQAGMLQSTYGNLAGDAAEQFSDNRWVIGNLFDLILSDWGRMQALGAPLQNGTIKWDSSVTAAVLANFDRSIRKQLLISLMAGVFYIDHEVNAQSGAPPTPTDLIGFHCSHPNSRANTIFAYPNNTNVWTFPVGPNGQLPSSGNDGQYYDAYIFYNVPGLPSCDSIYSNVVVSDQLLQPLFAPLDPNDSTQLGQYGPWFYGNQTQIPVQSFKNGGQAARQASPRPRE